MAVGLLRVMSSRWWDRCLEASRLVIWPQRRWRPNEAIVELDQPHDWTWRSTGNDPQFLLRKGLPLPGWHMLELELAHDQPSVAVRLYFDTGGGFSEEHSLTLPLKSGRVTKRLIFVRHRLRRMRFDPMEAPGHFAIRHLRIVWLSPWFAHDRLAQRLVNMHHRWRNVAKREVLAHLKEQARRQHQPWREVALADYEETFERLCSGHSYSQWLVDRPPVCADDVARDLERLAYCPLISVLVPVHDPPLALLRECLDSVLAQHYPNWQLCIADDASRDPAIQHLLTEVCASDSRVTLVRRPQCGHICAASNSALALADGDYVALLDHDDLLTPCALWRVVVALQVSPRPVLLYSDEDKINERGERFEPHFKPNFNPDLLLAQNYLSHLGVYETATVKRIGGFRSGFEGSQDHDLALRVALEAAPGRVVHIPHVLYHWRACEGSTALAGAHKDYTTRAGIKAIDSFLSVQCPGAGVEPGGLPNTYRVRWPLPDPAPMVSLLIPTRDRVDILKPCVDAILERTRYPNFEVLILDNGTCCEETLAYLARVGEGDRRVRILSWDHPFNYSGINNFGASRARGDILGLINNDIEPIGADWLEEMVRQAVRPEIGCVGAKLYYPNDTIQHAGVVLGIGGVAGHSHKYFSRHSPGYFSRLLLTQNYSAVTGACLLVRKRLFEEVGGLNARDLPVAFNDVDLCLKIRAAGYRNLWTPYAELYHHESMSRGADDSARKRSRASGEVEYMRRTWGEQLDVDPAYNPNLTLVHEDFSLR